MIIYEAPCVILPEMKEIGCCMFTVNKWQCIKEIPNPSISHPNGKKTAEFNFGYDVSVKERKNLYVLGKLR